MAVLSFRTSWSLRVVYSGGFHACDVLVLSMFQVGNYAGFPVPANVLGVCNCWLRASTRSARHLAPLL